MFMLACPPCRIVAVTGKQGGAEDPDAAITISAWADVADHFGIPFIAGEEHANVATLHNGEVLRLMDERQLRGGRTRTPRIAGAPLGAEIVHDTGVVELRRRLGFQYEHEKVTDAIGPNYPLRISTATPCISDVLLPEDQIPEHLYVVGRLEHLNLPRAFDRRRPTRAAILHTGEDGVLREGSAVALVDDKGKEIDTRNFVLYEFTGPKHARLFFDDRKEPEWIYNWPLKRLKLLLGEHYVYHIKGVAGTTTDFGVPPQWGDKQLILVNGRARRFHEDELYAIGGDPGGAHLLRRVVPEMSASKRRRHHGKSLTFTLANALCKRLRERIDDYIDVLRERTPRYEDRFETGAARNVVQLGDATAVVVFLHLDEDRKLHALVNVDPVGLPGTTVAVNHRDVVDITVKDYSKFIAETGVDPAQVAYHAGELRDPVDGVNTFHVVVVALGEAHRTARHATMRWLKLDEARHRAPVLDEAIRLAMSTFASQR